ncbi:hypothetical protein EB093_02610 [bacterium]|nr:hypothetical protein [bacterium]
MNIYPIVYYNDAFVPGNKIPFPFDDYGFLYGYGLFETVRVVNKTPILLDRHWSRLESSAIILGIELTIDFARVAAIANELMNRNPISDHAILNIYITPGDRPVGTNRIVMGKPMVLIVMRPHTRTKYNVGIHLGIRQESFQRIQLDQFKMLSYVKNILEKSLCDPYDDVLLFSETHAILETPTANVFFVRGRTLFTPKSDFILPGVTRGFILEKSTDFGFSTVTTEIKLADLNGFDEIFLTSSLKGIVKVDKIEKFDPLKSGQVTDEIETKYHLALDIPILPKAPKYGPT